MIPLLLKNKGVTIIEVLVTLSVFVMVSTSIVANYRNSTKSVILNTLAHQIITEIRYAQTYATANIIDSSGGTLPYGVFFSSASPNSFIVFADKNKDGLYNAGTDTLINTFKLKNNNTISNLCVNLKKTPPVCNILSPNTLNITFVRPYPEPIIKTGVGDPVSGAPYGDAEITLSSGLLQKTIVIWKTGQLAIE
jgi:type II secretory pathway pseudopilin PulG